MSISSALCYDVMSSSLLSQMYTKYIVSILTHLQIQELKGTLHCTHPQLANRTLRVCSLVCHEVQGGNSQFYILEKKKVKHNNIYMCMESTSKIKHCTHQLAGGLCNAVHGAVAIGGKAFGMSLRNQRQWLSKSKKEKYLRDFRMYLKMDKVMECCLCSNVVM